MASGDYPAGAANDSNAPYNEVGCPCLGTDINCDMCGGSGYISPAQYEEWLRDKKESADEDRD